MAAVWPYGFTYALLLRDDDLPRPLLRYPAVGSVACIFMHKWCECMTWHTKNLVYFVNDTPLCIGQRKKKMMDLLDDIAHIIWVGIKILAALAFLTFALALMGVSWLNDLFQKATTHTDKNGIVQCSALHQEACMPDQTIGAKIGRFFGGVGWLIAFAAITLVLVLVYWFIRDKLRRRSTLAHIITIPYIALMLTPAVFIWSKYPHNWLMPVIMGGILIYAGVYMYAGSLDESPRKKGTPAEEKDCINVKPVKNSTKEEAVTVETVEVVK